MLVTHTLPSMGLRTNETISLTLVPGFMVTDFPSGGGEVPVNLPGRFDIIALFLLTTNFLVIGMLLLLLGGQFHTVYQLGNPKIHNGCAILDSAAVL